MVVECVGLFLARQPREVFPTEVTSDEEMERGTSAKMDECKQNSSITEL
jgi:hypothetical protein